MKFKVYFKPFNAAGAYVDEFIDVTDDVVTLGDITSQSDTTDFDIGIFRTGGFTIVMRNDKAKYSTADNQKSMFRTRRNRTQVKITWDRRDYDLTCGFFQCGYEEITDEEIVFEGVLQDIVSELKAEEQNISFKILGFESLFNELVSPSSFVTSFLFSEVLYTLLNQTMITELLTLDVGNINVGIDKFRDSTDSIEGINLKDAIEELLIVSGSVLIIQDRTIFVKDRSATDDVLFTFYGQGSINGLENIVNIERYKDGLAKAYNWWEWNDTDLFRVDLDYVSEYGLLKNSIDSEIMNDFTSSSDMEDILDYYVDSFKDPKTEFDLETPIEYEQLYLRLYDKVIVDYPTVYIPADDNPLPRYGQNFYGEARYPFGQYSLKINENERFKIIGRKVNVSKGTITFNLRRV